MTRRRKVISVILCCGEEDSEALKPVARTLCEEALEAQVLSGVDLDAAELARHMARPRDAGVFVLCASEHLDAYQIPKLKEAFSNHTRVTDRLLEIDFDVEDPDKLLRIVRGVASRLAGGDESQPTVMFDAAKATAKRRWPSWQVLTAAAVIGIALSYGYATWSSPAPVADVPPAVVTADVKPPPAKETPPDVAPEPVADPVMAAAEPELPEAAPEPSTIGDADVTAAIEAGKIRSLNELLVARESEAQLSWLDAVNHCKLRPVGKVWGWRLPSIAELERLRRARLIRKGVYWSTNRPGKDPAQALVLSTDHPRPREMAKSEKARAQCVRAREQEVR